MGYSGRTQVICANHHYYEVPDNYSAEIDYYDCPFCEAEAIWLNDIDDTNCDERGKVEVELKSECKNGDCSCQYGQEKRDGYCDVTVKAHCVQLPKESDGRWVDA